MKELSNHAAAAKMIRKELKEGFSQITFRVRARSYSGGSSVYVYWTDGPKTEEVNTIVGKYQYGHFDGMTDMYEYSNTDDSIPQVRFVMTNREMSPEREGAIRAKIEKLYAVDLKDDKAIWDQFRAYPSEVIYREFNTGWYTEDIGTPEDIPEQVEEWMSKLINCGCIE